MSQKSRTQNNKPNKDAAKGLREEAKAQEEKRCYNCGETKSHGSEMFAQEEGHQMFQLWRIREHSSQM